MSEMVEMEEKLRYYAMSQTLSSSERERDWGCIYTITDLSLIALLIYFLFWASHLNSDAETDELAFIFILLRCNLVYIKGILNMSQQSPGGQKGQLWPGVYQA